VEAEQPVEQAMKEFECALTGIVEPATQPDASDGLDSLPVGWTKITIARRSYNPKWLMIQQVKNAMMEGLMSQLPADIQDLQRLAIDLQVEAQFHSIEKDTPTYVKDIDDVVYLSDSGDIVESINEVRALIGLDAIVADVEEDEDDDEEEGVVPDDGSEEED
jgi:hypothetical protein